MAETKLNLGIFAGGLSWPVYVAQDEHLFRDDGLDVAVHAVEGSVDQIKAAMDGTYDVIMTPFDNVVAYDEGQGEVDLPGKPDLFAFMGGINGCLRLIGASRYEKIEQLKGTTIGVDAEHTGYTLAMYELLDRAGVPQGSYGLSRTGGTTYRVEALESGSIAATMVSSPQEIVPEQKGFRRLGDVFADLGEYQAVCGVARRSWAAANGPTLERFIRAYVHATDFLRGEANAAAASRVFERHVDGSTASLASQALAIMTGREGFQAKAAFSPAGAAEVMRIRERFGTPKRTLTSWQAYVDETFYHKAIGPGA